MQLLRNLSIRFVMLSILGILCLTLGCVSFYSDWSLSRVSDGNTTDRQLVRQLTVLNQGNDQYFRFISRLNREMQKKAEGEVPDFKPSAEAMENMGLHLAEMKRISPGPMDVQMSERVIARWQTLYDEGVKIQMQLAEQGDQAGYRKQSHDVTPQLSKEFGTVSLAFTQVAEAQIEQTRMLVDGLMTTTRIVIISGALFGLLILVFADRYLVTMMQRPLNNVRQHFRRIAGGDLSQPVENDAAGRNCVGKLFPLLSEMQGSLRDAVSSIREGSDTLRASASEIARGNTDLSSRTEQQAAALEETAASMEEITATVKLNADHAHHASELAEVTSSTAHQGHEMIASVIRTMDEISDSSRKIAEITNVINSIAFQTNILALNASIEAARAGVHGRGFMVVAGEVRTLASNSADAAKEIERLIANAVSRVDQGIKQVAGGGETMEEIVRASGEVTAIMKEIAIASEEQTKGILQVGTAITQMDTVTQQNASLVSSVSETAAGLELQTQGLQRSVQKFRLSAAD